MTEPTVPRATGLAILDQIEAHRGSLESKLARLDALLAQCNRKQRRELLKRSPDWVKAYANGRDVLDLVNAIPRGEA